MVIIGAVELCRRVAVCPETVVVDAEPMVVVETRRVELCRCSVDDGGWVVVTAVVGDDVVDVVVVVET